MEKVIDELVIDIDFSQMSADLLNLAQALSLAVSSRFMAPEHATKIWRKWLSASGLDVPKIENKGGVASGSIEES